MEDFPTPATFISEDEVLAELDYLARTAPVVQEHQYSISNMLPDRSYGKSNATPIQGKLLLVPEYSKMDQVSGVYSGIARSKCRRRDETLSPYEYWTKNKNEVLKKAGTNASLERIEGTIWKLARGCGAFKPRVAAGVMKLFNATRVLDFSSGWGDRLFAAIALGIEYTGIDPNPDLQEPYRRMIEDLANDPRAYIMIESPFQTAELPLNASGEVQTYDLVFTSPPYYDLELYATDVEGTDLDSWKSEFLYPSINKAWSVLEIGGHLCLSINDFIEKPESESRSELRSERRVRYVEDMVRYISTLPGARNMNKMYRSRLVPYLSSATNSAGPGTIMAAPLWCWKKEKHREELPSKLNPSIRIEQYELDKRRLVNVIRDDLLEGGTKSRAIARYLSLFPDYTEFVYAGYEGGYGHVAVAIGAQALGKKATLFLQSGTQEGSNLVARSRAHGARIYLIPDKLYVATDEARKYCDRTMGATLIPLGMDNAEYQAQMVRALEEVWPREIKPRRMWIVAGSGRTTKSLQELLPETEMITVQIGRQLSGIQATYVSKYKLTEDVSVEDTPPYPASLSYDSKLWPFVMQYGQDGDYIWNVAGY